MIHVAENRIGKADKLEPSVVEVEPSESRPILIAWKDGLVVIFDISLFVVEAC